jgi:hypothetical protein
MKWRFTSRRRQREAYLEHCYATLTTLAALSDSETIRDEARRLLKEYFKRYDHLASCPADDPGFLWFIESWSPLVEGEMNEMAATT